MRLDSGASAASLPGGTTRLDLGRDIVPITLELERAIGIRVERPQGQLPRRAALPQLREHAVAVNVAAHDCLVSLVVLQSPLRCRASIE